MKKTLILFMLTIIICAAGVIYAQEDEEVFEALVEVDSAFVRAEPSRESDAAASVFEDQVLEVVGRNIDGTWFEVRRPGRLTNLGWIFNEMLDWDFAPENLPLTNMTVGVEGPTPLEEDPGFAIHLLYGATMRDSPSRQAGRITSVPRVATVPVLARNQDGSWLRVNYIGYVGWIITFTGRDLPDVMAVPEAPGLPPLEAIEVVIIPPEVQRAQVQRLRDFVVPRRDLAESLTYFWLAVYRGEVMPCDPPASVVEYQYSRADVRELPELDRYAPQLRSAVEYLNAALAPLQDCGVVQVKDVRQARAAAINARILFDAALDALDSLEEIIQ